MRATRIPVWLLTGFLGSGKTSLLASWLRDAGLRDALLIVNEIGEVGLDDKLLEQAVDSAGLIANACVCCTGLPGLQEALSNVWWDRLHRRRSAYGAVMIETTGLADPRPVIQAFEKVPLLRERYRLAGVIATVSAVAGLDVIQAHPEALAQVAEADALVITKCDRADGPALKQGLLHLYPRAGIGLSSNASLDWPGVLELLGSTPRDEGGGPAAHSHHDSSARFVPLEAPITRAGLQARVEVLRSDELLRLKGVVRLDDGALHTVQWSLGDQDIAIDVFAGEDLKLGLTCIHQHSH